MCYTQNMNKITSADCKQYIVQWCQRNPDRVRAELQKILVADSAPVFQIKNWRRCYKQFNGLETERLFHCAPLTDANGRCLLSAYVTSGTQDTRVTGIEFLSAPSLSANVRAMLAY